MIALTRAREAAGLNRRQLGAAADLHPIRVGAIENERVRPYDGELARLAAALDWPGDPAALLLEELDDAREG
jgi:transcriptional regulator with XRE-family HTH domain